MIRTSHPVLRALQRWETKGLLTPDTTQALRTELEEELRGEGRRWSQYLLAATGGAILIIAGATFLAWVWPGMGPAGQRDFHQRRSASPFSAIFPDSAWTSRLPIEIFLISDYSA